MYFLNMYSNNIYMFNIKKISLFSILLSLSVILSITDRYISALCFSFLPNVKIGLANIIILFSIYNYSFKESMILTFLKSFISSFLFGAISTFIIGGISSIISFFVMQLFKRSFANKLGILSVSLAGGFTHTLSQLFIIYVMYSFGLEIFIYGIPLLFVSIMCSTFVAFISLKISYIYKNKSY